MATKNFKRLMLSLGLNVIMIGFCVYTSMKALEYRAHINEFLYKYEHVVQEFSARNKFLDADRTLASDTIVPGRIVFFGMTMTDVWPVTKFFPDNEAIERGVSMQRLAGMPLRFRSDVIRLMPEWVVIETSSYNLREPNTLEELEEYTADMAELADYHGIKPILTTLIPPTSGYEPFESNYNVFDSLTLFNNWVKDYAGRKGFAVVDVHDIMAGDNGAVRVDLTEGGIIPNEEGFRLISEAVLNEMANYKPRAKK